MSCRHLIAFILLLAPASAQAEATLSLKAVAKNGIPIAPTNSLGIARGDIITAEIYLSGWGNPPFDAPDNTGLVNTYQVTLAGKAGARSSGNCSGHCNSGYIVPVGWDAPLDKDLCPCDDGCYPIFDTTFGCVGPNFYPPKMASVSSGRADYVFPYFHGFIDLDLPRPDVIWVDFLNNGSGEPASRCHGGSNAAGFCSTNFDCPGGICDPNFPSYLGPLNLVVGATACNSYTFTFSADPQKTYIFGPGPDSSSHVPLIQPLILSAPDCPGIPDGACCTNGECKVVCLAACSEPNQRFSPGSTCSNIDPPCTIGDPIIVLTPPHCVIDARRPYPPNLPS